MSSRETTEELEVSEKDTVGNQSTKSLKELIEENIDEDESDDRYLAP